MWSIDGPGQKTAPTRAQVQSSATCGHGDGSGGRLSSGAVVGALAGVLYFLPFGVPGLVLARLALGAGEGCVFTAGATWTVDLAPIHARGRAIGLFGLSIWSALAVGPLIGQGLLDAAGY